MTGPENGKLVDDRVYDAEDLSVDNLDSDRIDVVLDAVLETESGL